MTLKRIFLGFSPVLLGLSITACSVRNDGTGAAAASVSMPVVSVVAPASVVEAPTSTSAPASTSTSAPAPTSTTTVAAPNHLSVDYIERSSAGAGTTKVSFSVLDVSGRNVTNDAKIALKAPDLPGREIRVAGFVPETPKALLLHGTTFKDGVPVGPGLSSWPARGVAELWIAFPLQDDDNNNATKWFDIPNHPKDVSAVLDILSSDPSLAGTIAGLPIVYTGASMAGISGLLFSNEVGFDPRIAAVVAAGSFAPDPSNTGYSFPYDWSRGPEILLVHTMWDEQLPYALAKATAAMPGFSGTVLTEDSKNHATWDVCAQSRAYVDGYLAHQLLGDPLPEETSLAGSCAQLGLVDGGSTGLGLLAPLAP